LPAELEAVVLALVAEKGVHGFSLAEASRRAGVSVAAPYRHYADRGALLAQIALRGYADQESRFAAAMAGESEPGGQLAAFAAAYVHFAAEQAALFDITFAAGLDKRGLPELERAGRRVLDVLLGPARRLRASETEAEALVVDVGAVAHGFATFYRDGIFGSGPKALRRAAAGAAHAAELLADGAGDPALAHGLGDPAESDGTGDPARTD